MVRLIATDLDGTLLEPDGTLPDGIFEVIESLNECGIRFAASSGRQYGNLARLFAPAAAQMAFSCENGAFCVLAGQEAGTIAIPNETAMEIIEDIERLHMNLLISGVYLWLNILQWMCLYSYFASADPGNKNVYTVIGILINVTMPFFIFICRHKDGGMPPRKEDVPPVIPAPVAEESGEEEPVNNF